MMLSLFVAACVGQLDPPALHIRKEGDARRVVVVAVLPDAIRQSLPEGKDLQERAEALLRFTRLKEGKEGPPMLGAYERRDNQLTFRPRLELDRGATFRATLDLGGGKVLTRDYRVPLATPGPPAHVVKVYPTADVLSANHLKFYIYFSRPMRGGEEIFKQIKLLDADGKEITDPWLLDELWDDENNCLILYIHPGRIKWGVLLRELLGPVLYPNREYRLVIPTEFIDDRGQKLGKGYVKKFRTVAEDRVPIDTGKWTVRAPKANGGNPLTIDLGKPIDHRGLERFIQIVDANGAEVKGKIEVGREEKTWKFTPRQSWQAGAYAIRIDPRLEDTNGNLPTRPFDLDLKASPPPKPRLSLPFQVK